MTKLKGIVETHRNKPLYVMIIKLNQVLRGWAVHYRTTTATRTFSAIGAYLYRKIRSILKFKHIGIPLRTLRNKYFTSIKGNNWVLRAKDAKGNIITLFQMGWVVKQRHMCCQPLNPSRKYVIFPEENCYWGETIHTTRRKQNKVS